MVPQEDVNGKVNDANGADYVKSNWVLSLDGE